MDIHLAILQLGKNNNQYTVKDDGSGIQEWRGSDPQPTEAELTQGWVDCKQQQQQLNIKMIGQKMVLQHILP